MLSTATQLDFIDTTSGKRYCSEIEEITEEYHNPQLLTESHRDLIEATFNKARSSIWKAHFGRNDITTNLANLLAAMLEEEFLVKANIILKNSLDQPGTWLIPKPYDNPFNSSRHKVFESRGNQMRSAYDHLRYLHGHLDDILFHEAGMIRKKKVFKGVPFGTTPRKTEGGYLFKDYNKHGKMQFFRNVFSHPELAPAQLIPGIITGSGWPKLYVLGKEEWKHRKLVSPGIAVTPRTQNKENFYVHRGDILDNIIKNQQLERGTINLCYGSKRRGGGGDLKVNLIGLLDLCGAPGSSALLNQFMSVNVSGSYVRLQGIADAIYTEVTEADNNKASILYGQMIGYSVEHVGSLTLDIAFSPNKLMNEVTKIHIAGSDKFIDNDNMRGFPSVVASTKFTVGLGSAWNVNSTETLYILNKPKYTDNYNNLIDIVGDYIPFMTHEKAMRYSRVALDQINKSANPHNHESHGQYSNSSLRDIKEKCGTFDNNKKAKDLYSSIAALEESRTTPDKTLKQVNKADANIFGSKNNEPKNILWIKNTVHKLSASVDAKFGIDPKVQKKYPDCWTISIEQQAFLVGLKWPMKNTALAVA
jgi:hypothetical protein